MRALLSVKWKLILVVVGVSFLSLTGLVLRNQYQAERFTLERSHELLRDAAGLTASRYNQVAENVYTILGGMDARIVTELEYARENNTAPDASRIGNFTAAYLENTHSYVRTLGVLLIPGVMSDAPELTKFSNPQGYTVLKFSRELGATQLMQPMSESEIQALSWWKEVVRSGKGMIAEPLIDTHHPRAGGVERHVECSFVKPLKEGGRFIGVVWSEVCLDEYQAVLADQAYGVSIARGVLVSPKGATVGYPASIDVSGVIPRSGSSLSRLKTDEYPEIMEAVSSNKPYNGTLTLGGKSVLVASTPIRREEISNYWSVLVFQSKEQALMASRATLARQIYDGLGMLLVSLFLGYLAAVSMSRTLSSTERWHRTLLDRVPLPLGILDLDSRWVYANPAIAKVLSGGDVSGLVGRLAVDSMPARDARFATSTNTPEAGDIETLEVGSGNNRYHYVSSCRLLDLDGRYIGRLIIGVDVTDAREISRTLELAASIARSLDTKSDRILSAAQTLSDAAMQKSAAIEEITSTTQKIGENSTTYTKSARNSHSQAEATHGASDRGTTEAMQAAGAMNGVRDSGQKIRTIIKLIDDIAFQTNLLALNAAVEAARAGRNGKGFAVVADEVRNLAQRSARAARETSAMIEEMTGRIGDATDSIEQLSGTLIEIKENAENLRSNSDEVARLADQQAQSVHQVHLSLEQISQSVNSTITISRETATMAESILQQAAALRRLTQNRGEEGKVRTGSRVGVHSPADKIIDLEQYDSDARLPGPVPGGLLSPPSSKERP